jgi:hypothetical protein
VTYRKRAKTLRVLFATLVAMALFAIGAPASAAVPMCSEDGRTVAAPPIMRPSSGRVLESKGDCDRLRALLTRTHQGDHRNGSIEAGDAPLRAVPARVALPAVPRVARLSVTVDIGRALPATDDDLFRPPRS